MPQNMPTQNTTIGGGDCCSSTGLSNVHGTVQQTTACHSPSEHACCESGVRELCDEDCLRAIAAIECGESCHCADGLRDCCSDISLVSDHKHHDHHEKGDACGKHLRAAFEKYASLLAEARCLCKSVLGSRSIKCCATKSHAGHDPKKCSAGTEIKHVSVKPRAGEGEGTNNCCTSAAEFCGPQGCCDEKGCDTHNHHIDNSDHCVSDSCCGEANDISVCASAKEISADVEKGANREHVSITVDGMDCSGCGNKLQRALTSLPGVTNVSVNFIMKRAEFEINPSAARASDTITRAQQMTGFSLSRISTTDQTLEFLATTKANARALAAQAESIPGVTNTDIRKTSVTISYDPSTLGARTLASSIAHLTTGLAPAASSDLAISTGRARFRALALTTALSALLTTPVAVLAWSPELQTRIAEPTRAAVSLALATLVQCVAVREFYVPALRALLYSGVVEMDMLVVVSVTAAYAYSAVAFAFERGGRPLLATGSFFETSALLVTLILVGRVAAAWARVRAVGAASVRGVQAQTAVLVGGGDDGGGGGGCGGDVEREIDARLLQHGDVFRVAPHSKVPTDGVVVDGASEVDESMITGEAVPVGKGRGSAVVAGTINGEGSLVVRLVRLPGSNTVTDIAELVEDAFRTKPRIQDLADRVAGWFVWAVVAVAVVVLCAWVAVAAEVRNESGAKVADTALGYCIAVLAVSCPCALGLAVPMVLVVAGGVAARGGVVIRSAQAVERAHKVTDVVFDKTGTLTMQELDVVEEHVLIGARDTASSVTRALVAGNKHPVSAAVARFLESRSLDAAHVTASRVIPGSGVKATWEGVDVQAGNARWTGSESHPVVRRLLDDGLTVLCVTKAKANELVVVYGLKSALRPEASSVVSKLQAMNIEVHLVSGDEQKAVEAVRAVVGIPPQNAVARRTPAEKRVYIQQLMEKGKSTLFCGDGTNDAVAVAQADVGVQMGSSSDVTRATADVVLLSGLEGINFLLEVSAASSRRIIFNFAWSAAYNVFAILLAAGAFVTVRIPPAYAGLGELVSVLPVVFAAFTLSWIRRVRVRGPTR